MKCVFVAVAIAALSVTAAGAGEINPGQWTTSGTVTAVDMPGMPPEMLGMMKKRPISHSYCLTQAEIDKGPKRMFSEGNGECSYSKFNMAGGRLNAVMQCKGPQGNAQMTMLGTYTPDSYSSVNIMVMDGPQGKMRMTTKLSGKRTGPCKG